MPPVPAYILAGGQSRRFGSDKARALLQGRPLIRRLADRLQPAVATITVVADKPGKYADLGLSTIADEQPHLGPLGGLVTALQHLAAQGNAERLLLTACDLVEVNPDWIARLQSRPDAPAVAFRGERWEPLFALYHLGLIPLIRRQLAAGHYAMWSLLEEADAAAVPMPPDWPAIAQINTPEDHRRLQQQADSLGRN